MSNVRLPMTNGGPGARDGLAQGAPCTVHPWPSEIGHRKFRPDPQRLPLANHAGYSRAFLSVTSCRALPATTSLKMPRTLAATSGGTLRMSESSIPLPGRIS